MRPSRRRAARVAGRDDAVLAEGRAQAGELLQGGLAADALVDRHIADRHDLVGEAALVSGGSRSLVRGERDLVELLARELPAIGDHLRGQALGDEPAVVALEHLRREGTVAPDHVGEHRHPRHRLDPAGDDEVVVAGDEPGGGEVHGLLARAALPVDRGARDGLGEPGRERGVAGDVDALLTDLRDAAQITSSTSAGSTPARETRASSTVADRSPGCTLESDLPGLPTPTGVRTAPTMTASRLLTGTPRVGDGWPAKARCY